MISLQSPAERPRGEQNSSEVLHSVLDPLWSKGVGAGPICGPPEILGRHPRGLPLPRPGAPCSATAVPNLTRVRAAGGFPALGSVRNQDTRSPCTTRRHPRLSHARERPTPARALGRGPAQRHAPDDPRPSRPPPGAPSPRRPFYPVPAEPGPRSQRRLVSRSPPRVPATPLDTGRPRAAIPGDEPKNKGLDSNVHAPGSFTHPFAGGARSANSKDTSQRVISSCQCHASYLNRTPTSLKCEPLREA